MAMFYRFAQYSTTKAQLPQQEHLPESCETELANPTAQDSLRGDMHSLPFSRMSVQDSNHLLSDFLPFPLFSRIVPVDDLKMTHNS
jgi:hypothetical protein